MWAIYNVFLGDVMSLCKRCKKAEAMEGKKNCVACAKYMSEYMKRMRAKKKVLDAVKVPVLNIHKNLLIVNKKEVNKEIVNNDVNKIKQILNTDYEDLDSSSPVTSEVQVLEKINISPEHFRYFYFMITGKVFRKNNVSCVKELIKILEKELN